MKPVFNSPLMCCGAKATSKAIIDPLRAQQGLAGQSHGGGPSVKSKCAIRTIKRYQLEASSL